MYGSRGIVAPNYLGSFLKFYVAKECSLCGGGWAKQWP